MTKEIRRYEQKGLTVKDMEINWIAYWMQALIMIMQQESKGNLGRSGIALLQYVANSMTVVGILHLFLMSMTCEAWSLLINWKQLREALPSCNVYNRKTSYSVSLIYSKKKKEKRSWTEKDGKKRFNRLQGVWLKFWVTNNLEKTGGVLITIYFQLRLDAF